MSRPAYPAYYPAYPAPAYYPAYGGWWGPSVSLGFRFGGGGYWGHGGRWGGWHGHR